MEETKDNVTNGILAEQIKGLTKITDERLINLKEGIAEIKLLMQGFVTKMEMQEVKGDFNATIKRMEDADKRTEDAQLKHNKDDIENFGGLSKQMEFLTKTVWLGMGAVSVIVFFLQVILPYFLPK